MHTCTTYAYIHAHTQASPSHICISRLAYDGPRSPPRSPRARPRYIYIYILTYVCIHTLRVHTYTHTPRHLCIFSDGATKRRLGRPVTSRSPSVHIYAYIYMHNTMHYICIHKRTTQAYMSIPSDLR